MRRLVEEQKGPRDTVSTVASTTEIGVIGPTLFLDTSVEGEKMEAMVECGCPTTIISRSLLNAISRNMQCQQREPPELTQPACKVCGNDGKRELFITAQS